MPPPLIDKTAGDEARLRFALKKMSSCGGGEAGCWRCRKGEGVCCELGLGVRGDVVAA